jgi:hypothetical protein
MIQRKGMNKRTGVMKWSMKKERRRRKDLFDQ